MKYPCIDFCTSQYYEPDIGITMAEPPYRDPLAGVSFVINSKENLIAAFKQCLDDEFESYMSGDMSLSAYKQLLYVYESADMEDVIKNLTVLHTIDQRAYDLPEKSAKSVLKKVFGDTNGYGDFYQRFKALDAFETITYPHEEFLRQIKKVLSEKQQKVLFKDNDTYEAKKKAERITRLKEQLKKEEQQVVTSKRNAQRIRDNLKELEETND